MGWRRKQAAGAPASPSKGRRKKQGTAESKAQQSDSVEGCSDDDDHCPDRQVTLPGAFFGCYLLSSINPKRKGATYIGFTVNPARRLRQHNGELTAGAWKTKKMRPVEMVLVVYGFPSMVHALQFEWAWQHPTVSLAVKEAAAGIKNRAGVKGKVALLYAMLSLPKWKKLPLVVQFVSSRHLVHKLGMPPLPDHMDCILAPLSNLRIKVDDTAQDPPIVDPPDQPPASAPYEEAPEEGGSMKGQDVAPRLDSPGQGPAPPTPPSLHSSGDDQSRPPPRSTFGWADPLSDWDWLDQEGPNLGNESSTEGRGEVKTVDAFSTWQRLKAPKWTPRVSPKTGSKEGVGVSRDRSLCGTLEREGLDEDRLQKHGDKCVERERSERSAVEAVHSNGAVPSDRPQTKGAEPTEREVPGQARDCGARALTGPQCLAPPDSLSLLKRNSVIANDCDLVQGLDETSCGYQGGVSTRMSPEIDWWRGIAQARDSRPTLAGIELVVLEDSPPFRETSETRKLRLNDKALGRRDCESRSTLSLEGTGLSIQKAPPRKGEKGRLQETIIIDLDF